MVVFAVVRQLRLLVSGNTTHRGHSFTAIWGCHYAASHHKLRAPTWSQDLTHRWYYTRVDDERRPSSARSTVGTSNGAHEDRLSRRCDVLQSPPRSNHLSSCSYFSNARISSPSQLLLLLVDWRHHLCTAHHSRWPSHARHHRVPRVRRTHETTRQRACLSHDLLVCGATFTRSIRTS